MATVNGVATTPGAYNVTEGPQGGVGSVTQFSGDGKNDTFQGEADQNYYYGGGGSNTYIIGQRFLHTESAIGGSSAKTVDAIYDFHGAGTYDPSGDDFIAFSGFAKGTTFTVISSEASTSATDPNGVLFYYDLHDAGTNKDYVVAIRSTNGHALSTSDYAFY